MSGINTAALLAAIQEGKPWIDRFTKRMYKDAFEEYQERYATAYREMVLSAGKDGIPALAEALLDGLAAGWAKQRIWNRSVAKMEDRQMIVCYLSPMLLRDPLCAPLAEALREGWAARWTKEAYQITTAEKLQKGFRNSILGIPLPPAAEDD